MVRGFVCFISIELTKGKRKQPIHRKMGAIEAA